MLLQTQYPFSMTEEINEDNSAFGMEMIILLIIVVIIVAISIFMLKRDENKTEQIS